MHSDSRRRLQNLSPPLFPLPTIMAMLEEQVALLMQQIQALQNQLSAWTPSPPVDLPPPPATAQLLKIPMPTPFTGRQDDLDCFNVESSLYICLRGSTCPDDTSCLLLLLSYTTGTTARTVV